MYCCRRLSGITVSGRSSERCSPSVWRLHRFLSGFLVSQSFRETYQDDARALNERRQYEEPRFELRKMLQRDPAELNDVDMHRMINPVMYDRIKKELGFVLYVPRPPGSRAPSICPARRIARFFTAGAWQLHNMNHSIRLCDIGGSPGRPRAAMENRYVAQD